VKGLHAIGMIKEMRADRFDGKSLTLKALYVLLTLAKVEGQGDFGLVLVQSVCYPPVKPVFAKNRNRRRDWLTE